VLCMPTHRCADLIGVISCVLLAFSIGLSGIERRGGAGRKIPHRRVPDL
jgi:hypothetical protein